MYCKRFIIIQNGSYTKVGTLKCDELTWSCCVPTCDTWKWYLLVWLNLRCLPVVSCRDPSVCGLQSAHRGPLHPQSAGQTLAQQVPQVQRLPGSAGREVLQPGRQRLLQGRFLQVSTHSDASATTESIKLSIHQAVYSTFHTGCGTKCFT